MNSIFRFIWFIISANGYLIACIAAEMGVGDDCMLPRSGTIGVCRLIKDCASVQENVVKMLSYTKCGYANSMPIVCCPKPAEQPTERPIVMTNRTSAQQCRKYAKMAYETRMEQLLPNQPAFVKEVNVCASLTVPLIVGGEAAAPKEFPHMALLGYQEKQNSSIDYLCAGSLISEQFVLTAAHCIAPDPIIGEVKYVRLGELVLNTDDDDAMPVVFNVAERIVHENYRDTEEYNDIALIRMDRMVTFNRYVRPACLSETFMDAIDNKAIASGWGRTGQYADSSDVLMKVGLELYSQAECHMIYDRDSGLLAQGILDKQQFCAGDHKNEKDTCQGDSGGPIQIHHKYHRCMYTILGVTSFGQKCGDTKSAGVYTRVYGYLDWIEQRVWPQQ